MRFAFIAKLAASGLSAGCATCWMCRDPASMPGSIVRPAAARSMMPSSSRRSRRASRPATGPAGLAASGATCWTWSVKQTVRGTVCSEQGLVCGLHRIERLMRINALRARPRRRGKPKDDGERLVIADIEPVNAIGSSEPARPRPRLPCRSAEPEMAGRFHRSDSLSNQWRSIRSLTLDRRGLALSRGGDGRSSKKRSSGSFSDPPPFRGAPWAGR